MSEISTIHFEYVEQIQNNVLFSNIDASVLPHIATKLQKLSVKKDELIFKQLDETKGLYLVVSGNIEISTQHNNKHYTLSHALNNHVVGEFLLLGDGIRTTSAKALEDSELFYLSIVDFNYLFELFQHQFHQQFETIANRITNRLCWNQISIALRLSPLFLDLSEDIVRTMIKELKTDSVPANTLLYQKGVTSTELCIVVDGRFQVAKMVDGERIMLDVIGRGETIGEIGVLCDTVRMVDIMAVRDSIVARLSRESFEKILLSFPLEINRAFSKNIAARLSHKKTNAREIETFTIALVVLSPAIVAREIAECLATELKHNGSTSVVDSEMIDRAFGRKATAQTDFNHVGNNALLHWLAEWEIAHKNVIYVVDPEINNWTLRCLREADHIIFVSDANDSPAIGQFETQILKEIEIASKKKTLLIMHNPLQQVPMGTSEWLQMRKMGMHHHVRYQNASDFGRVARFLIGKAVGLVLGGGGARGFAHVGILRALEELKIPIDLIGGNSMGAIIAAQSALQWNHNDMIKRTLQLCMGGDNFTLPIISLLSGKKMSRGLYDMFGEIQIDDLWHHFYTISCNISRATVVTHDSGSLLTAVLNSNSPPGLFPPQIWNGDLHVDGALLNNVPVDVMRKYNEGGTVIGVDVNEREELLNNTDISRGISGWDILFNKLNPFSEKMHLPNMIGILNRASIIGGLSQRKKMMDGYADLYLQPPVNAYSLMDYKNAAKIAESGYQYGLVEFQKWLDTQS
jgi:NTE family protein/lysophospholipid hydrolase